MKRANKNLLLNNSEYKILDIQGSKMYIDKQDPMHLKRKKVYDENSTNIIKKYARGGCIDVGAHIGYMTLLMAKEAAMVYAFEPNPINFEVLNENVKLNNEEKNIKIYNYAVVDYSIAKEIDLHLCDFNSGMSRIYPSKWCQAGKIKVKTIQLDEMEFESVDFVKIDAEGSEYGVLMGMKETIEKWHPMILMEFHAPSIRECGDNPRNIYKFLQDNHYTKFKLLANFNTKPREKDIDDISYEKLEEITYNKSSKNIVCM